MEKLKKILGSDFARQALSVLVIFLAAFCCYPSRGALSVFALFVFAGLIVPFFYDEFAFNAFIAALSCAVLSLVEYRDTKEILFSAIVLFLLFCLSMGASRLIKRFFIRKSILRAGLGIVLALLIFISYFGIFGNPIALFGSQKKALAYFSETYPNEIFSLQESHYNINDRTYVTTVSYNTGKAIQTAQTDASSKYLDTYFTVMRADAAEQQRSLLLSLLHKRFSDGLYRISVNSEKVQKSSVIPYKFGDNPEEWQPLYSYTLEFDSAIQTEAPSAKAEFAALVSSYAAALAEEGFLYSSMEFRGGEQNEMKYSLSVESGTAPSEITAADVQDIAQSRMWSSYDSYE